MPLSCLNTVIRIQSTVKNVYWAEESLIGELAQAGVDSSTLFAVRIVLDEALINAFQHGNRSDPARCITIESTFNRDYVQFVITDEGDGFDPAEVLDPTTPDQVGRASGRGLFLIREFASAVTFNERGNRITIVVRLHDGVERKPALHWLYRDVLIIELFDACAQLKREQLVERLATLVRPEQRWYVIDLKRLSVINGAIVEFLVEFCERVRSGEGTAVLARPCPNVMRVLVERSLAATLPCHPDIGTAISQLARAV